MTVQELRNWLNARDMTGEKLARMGYRFVRERGLTVPLFFFVLFLILLLIGIGVKPKDDAFNSWREEVINDQSATCFFEGIAEETVCIDGRTHYTYILYSLEICGYDHSFMWETEECGNEEPRPLNTDFICYFDVPLARTGHVDCTSAEVGLKPFVSGKKRAGIDCIIAAIVFGCVGLVWLWAVRDQWRKNPDALAEDGPEEGPKEIPMDTNDLEMNEKS